MTLDEGIIHAEDVARSNHEAATYLADEHPTQAEKCEECAREHRQLAEWLKELKAYREQSGDAISRKYILDLIDTKGANLDDDLLIVEQWIQDAPSVNPHPIECEDAISREAAVNAIYDLCGENVSLKENPWRDNPHIDAVVEAIEELPSVTPQRRTGEWIERSDIISKWYECDQCHTDWGGPVNFCPNCGAKMEVE